jgi:hypothetical protein
MRFKDKHTWKEKGEGAPVVTLLLPFILSFRHSLLIRFLPVYQLSGRMGFDQWQETSRSNGNLSEKR